MLKFSLISSSLTVKLSHVFTFMRVKMYWNLGVSYVQTVQNLCLNPCKMKFIGLSDCSLFCSRATEVSHQPFWCFYSDYSFPSLIKLIVCFISFLVIFNHLSNCFRANMRLFSHAWNYFYLIIEGHIGISRYSHYSIINFSQYDF